MWQAGIVSAANVLLHQERRMLTDMGGMTVQLLPCAADAT